MITVRTSPQYVNRVRQDWTANGGVYGDDGVYAIVPSNDPFAQLGPTLDLTFAGIPTNQFTAATTDGYSINLNLSSEIYQIAAEYVVWSDYQVRYSLLPNALINAALNIEPEKSLFKDTLIGGRPLGDINNDGTVTSADATAYTRFNGSFWLNTADRNDYIRTVLNPYMLANPGLYAAYLSPGPLAAKTFADVITFTRASTGTYFDSAGVLQSAANDQPRFDYNPSTLAAQGLLIEEQRTNGIRNNTMQGAVAGTPGTLPTNWTFSTTGAATTQVVGTGTENGITYIDIRFQGTGAADTWNIIYDTSVVAANGQSWTSAVYLKLAAGSAANLPLVQRLVFRNSSFVNIQALDSSAITPTNAGLATQRSTLSLTATQATTAFVTNQLNSGTPTGAYDITLRIGLPQLEQGAFATSVIPTTTTALTRSADVASVNTLSPWWNASEGTFYVEGSAGSLANSPIFVMPHDGTSNNYLNSPLLTTAGLARLAGVVGGAAWTNVNTANSTTANTTFKSASAFKAGDQAICLNAGTVATGVNASVPVVTTVKLGDWRTSGNSINGYLRRISYFPRRLANADLQTITT